MFGGLGSNGSLGMGVVMSLQDDFTGSANTIENSMKKLEGVTDAMTNKVTSALSYLKKGLMTAGIGLALLVPLGMAVEKAAELSDQMADVRKSTGMATASVVDFRNNLMEIDTRTSTSELLDIAKIGGQLGVAENQIFDFTKAIDMANVALGDEFSGGAESITKALGTIKNLFAETKAMDYGVAMTKIGSAINSLGAAGQATGENIANFTNRIGQLGRLGPAINEAMALGAVLQEVGIEGQVGAGGLTVLITEVTELTKQHNRLKDFATQMGITQMQAKALFNSSRGDFIIALAKSFEGLAPYEIGNRLKSLGLQGSEVQRVFGSLSENTGMYADRLRIVNEQMGIATSLQQEFNIKNLTAGAIIDKMGKTFSDMVVIIGEAATPVFMKMYEVFTKISKVVKTFAQSDIGKLVIQILAVAGVALTFVGIVIAIKGAFMAVAAIMPAVGAAVWGALAPLLPILIPLVLLVWGIQKAWSSFMDVLDGKAKAADGILGFFQRMGAALWTVKQVWDSWNGQTFDLGGRESELQAMGILEQMKALGTWVVRVKELFSGFGEAIGEMLGFLKKQWMGFKTDFGSILDYLGVNLGKIGLKLDWFKTIGKALAYIVFGPLVAAFTLFRWTLTGIIVVVAAVSAIFYGLYDTVKYVFSSIYDFFHSFNLGDIVSGWWDGLKSIGTNIVNAIFEGITQGWHMITDWINEKIDMITGWSPFSSDGDMTPQLVPVNGGFGNRINSKVNEVQNMRSQPGNNYYSSTSHSTQGAQNAQVDLHLDGEKIGKAMIDFQQRNDSLQ
jgi:TP901 family phage tail tape measure protein